MSSRIFSSDQRTKLNQLFNEGVGILQEVQDLNEGLSSAIKSVAEELDIKPSLLKRAMRIAQKSKFTDEQANHEELESILTAVNRTL